MPARCSAVHEGNAVQGISMIANTSKKAMFLL